jgi:hypothetical protein
MQTTRIAYIASTSFTRINDVALKMLRRIASHRGVAADYIDLSCIWDVYYPGNLDTGYFRRSAFKTFAKSLRAYGNYLVLRIKLGLAGTGYLSIGKSEIKAEFARLDRALSHLSCEDILEFDLIGYPLKSILFHDAALFLKIHDFSALDTGRKHDVRRMALLLLATYQIVSRMRYFQAPCRLFSFEGYSMNILLKLMMKQKENDLIFFSFPSHKNTSFDRIEFTSDTLPSRRRRKCLYWEAHCDSINLSSNLLSESLVDIETRLFKGGSHVYSPSVDAELFCHHPLQGRAGNLQLPVVSVFTSSMDEFVATQHLQSVFQQELPDSAQLFSSQVDMLIALARLANECESFQLVIRHHPRLGQAKDNTRSQYYEALCYALDELRSPYVHVIMPEDPISSYWLLAWSSCVLNAWSNIGLESLRLGVPVLNMFSEYRSVCYWPLTLFPSLSSFSDVKSFILDSLNLRAFTDKQKHLLLLSHNFYTFMNYSSYSSPDQDLLLGITQTSDWEAQSFKNTLSLVYPPQVVIKSPAEVANLLVQLMHTRIPELDDGRSSCPLLQRLYIIGRG